MDKPIRVLIADDDNELLMTYNKFVQKAGFSAILAHDGEEALSIATTFKPEIIILDVDMPKKDGLSVLAELRQTEYGKDLPIIILTGKDVDDSRIEKIVQWKPTYYFVKGGQSSDEFIATLKGITIK